MKRLALLLLFLAAPACADLLPARGRPTQAAPANPKPTGCAAPTGAEAALVVCILLGILVLREPRLRRVREG